ncbi:MAG: putative baseplate assembly protein [Nitrospirales bacterium]|nr:putative baseplate assembly protein [Nitrospirales bacterium]
MNTLVCRKEPRREEVRKHTQLNGLDYLEVGSNQLTLKVFFLGKAPVSLEASNVVIEGGRRIRDIKIKDVMVTRPQMAELDDFMEVFIDKAGDFSTYTLRVVIRDENGHYLPHPSFDPRYDRVEFSFKVDCPSDLDCKQEIVCPPEPREEPVINYLAKDYTSFRQLILDRLALVMPEWQERHVPDLGIALAEVLAYAGDHLSYYQDAVATEAYLATARQRISVRRHTRLVDYVLHEGCNARTWVCLETDSVVTLDSRKIYFLTQIDHLGRVVKHEELQNVPRGGYEVFEPMTDLEITFYPGQHEIHFYTWGNKECCLPRGTTTATLVGRWIKEPPVKEPPSCDPARIGSLKDAKDVMDTTGAPGAAIATDLHLKPGDVLIFEERIGPKTGNPADADPKHRHPVRITRVKRVEDPLYPEEDLTEITWMEEDALPFPLCLSAMGPPPDCEIIENISVACGNLVLVDHGQSIQEDLDPVPVKETIDACDCTGHVIDTLIVPDRYRPILKEVPLTFRQSLTTDVPASRMLIQDPRQALPQVSLTSAVSNIPPATWSPQRDLLYSQNQDLHFVVEMESDRRAQLRFGDDELGQQPEAGTAFHAVYRMGNGPSGNSGSGSIAHLVTRNFTLSGGILSIRNPLPARGGTAPEPIIEAKLFAPHAFKQRLERAITVDDYAAIVQREFSNRVQRAAATLRWNGSWYEVLVAVDPLGKEEADSALLEEIAARLHRYCRIGHNLVVKTAHRVPLDIELIVCVLPTYLRGHVKAILLEIFSNRRLNDGTLGLFHVDHLTFGDDMYLSTLIAAAQGVPGVESVKVTKLQRLYEPANGEIENGLLPLGPLEIARLDNDPSFPENGRIRFDVRGGR